MRSTTVAAAILSVAIVAGAAFKRKRKPKRKWRNIVPDPYQERPIARLAPEWFTDAQLNELIGHLDDEEQEAFLLRVEALSDKMEDNADLSSADTTLLMSILEAGCETDES